MTDKLYEGECFGGPLHGQDGESRFPKGFVLVDKRDQKVWVYDYNEDGQFHSRPEAFLVNEKLLHARDGSNYDVRAYDDGEMPEDLEAGL